MARVTTTSPSLTLEPRIRRRVERAVQDLLDPDATVTFEQATTETTNAVPALLLLGLTTTASSGDLIAAAGTLEGRLNTVHKALNQVVDILQANLLALST